MSLTALVSSPAEQERKALRARIALGVKMLTNAGYAMIGGTFFRAVMEQRTVPALSYLWAGAGVAALVFALWLAPDGEDGRE
jgi:hypothetical protein